MRGLDVFRMVISPASSHTFRVSMVRNDFAAVAKFMVANGALARLLHDFPIEQFPHLCWRPYFPISPGVVRIFDALDTKLKSAFFPRLLTTAAEE